MAAESEGEGLWGSRGRGVRRLGWLIVAVVVVVAAVGVVGVIAGDDAGGPGGSGASDDGGEVSAVTRSPPALGDAARWTRFADPDAVTAIESDGDGDVWVGTEAAGLVRWDGDGGDYERHALPDEIAGESVRSLAVADDGAVWVATRSPSADHAGSGIARFDDGRWTAWPAGDEVPAGEAVALAMDDAGHVWAAFRASDPGRAQGGVARFDGDGWTSWTVTDGLPSSWVTSLAVDSGDVWVGTRPHGPEGSSGVARFDGDGWTTWTGDDGLTHSHVRSVTVGADAVWALTTAGHNPGGEAGIARFDGREWTTWSTSDELPGDRVASVTTGGDGSVWALARTQPPDGSSASESFSVPEHALVRFDGTEWTTEVAASELPFEMIMEPVVDDGGTVWAPVRQADSVDGAGGLAAFDGQTWTTHTSDDGLPHDLVGSVSVDGGTVWAHTAGGVTRFADGTWTSFATHTGPGRAVLAVDVDGDGNVWTAGAAGVARFDGDTWTRWTSDDGLAADGAMSLAVGDNGTVWAGTPNGVSRFDGQAWTSWTADDGLGQVSAIAVADDDTVWATMGAPLVRSTDAVGDTVRGVARFDGQTWTSWTGDDAPPGAPNDVAVDDQGTPWVASRVTVDESPAPSGAVSHFDDGQWTTHDAAEGLLDRPVRAVTVSDGGTVWAATRHGLARFDGHQWTEPLAADAKREIEASFANALALDLTVHDGALWIAGDGLAWLHDSTHTTLGIDDVADGVPHPPLSAVAVGDDAVWIATSGGLARFDRPSN